MRLIQAAEHRVSMLAFTMAFRDHGTVCPLCYYSCLTAASVHLRYNDDVTFHFDVLMRSHGSILTNTSRRNALLTQTGILRYLKMFIVTFRN